MVYFFLADGFEELEATAPIDILRRADVNVLTVGVGGQIVRGAHNITVIADMAAEDVEPDEAVEAVVLPGGMPGTLNLEKSDKVAKFIEYAENNGKVIAAICAAPSILGHKGLLSGKCAVCFPGFEKELFGAKVLKDKVVTDGNIITACGAGAAAEFGFELTEKLCGKETRKRLESAMLCDR